MTDWKLNFRAMIGRAYPRVVSAQREPSWVLFDIFLPLLGIAAFIYYYRAMGAPEVFTGFVVQVSVPPPPPPLPAVTASVTGRTSFCATRAGRWT